MYKNGVAEAKKQALLLPWRATGSYLSFLAAQRGERYTGMIVGLLSLFFTSCTGWSTRQKICVIVALSGVTHSGPLVWTMSRSSDFSRLFPFFFKAESVPDPFFFRFLKGRCPVRTPEVEVGVAVARSLRPPSRLSASSKGSWDLRVRWWSSQSWRWEKPHRRHYRGWTWSWCRPRGRRWWHPHWGHPGLWYGAIWHEHSGTRPEKDN